MRRELRMLRIILSVDVGFCKEVCVTAFSQLCEAELV